MSKRKLSLQQRRRIAEQRAAKRDAKNNNNIHEDQLGELLSGRIIAHFGREALVESTSKNSLGEKTTQKCHLRANLDLCTGDRVMWRPNINQASENGVIESREARDSEIQRPDIYGKLRTIAANVSQLVITIATKPEPHTNLIDRYLVAASLHKLNPILVINKSDIENSEKNTSESENTVQNIEALYRSLEIDVLKVSAKNHSGLDTLKSRLDRNTNIFVGQSGVGKSSLIKAVMPEYEDIRIGALSHSADKGRHTTTHSQLYHIPTGGYCIDSPGIREFGLWHATPDDVLMGFPEIAEFSDHCKFRDCKHDTEPGCAIKNALAENKITPERWSSYQAILLQLDDVTIQTHSEIKKR